MHLLVYNLFLLLYKVALRLVSPWNPKARSWLAGRKQLLAKVEAAMAADPRPRIWMHCASLGEFEQGRPLLESIRQAYPDHSIVLTFFSPSGYEVRKNYEQADHIFYLPADSKANASRFVRMLNPVLVVWIKYDYWYYYLSTLRQAGIPLLLISASFKKKQAFFRWHGALHRYMLDSFSRIFVQNEESIQLLKQIGLADKAVVSGDTRFDRVSAIASLFTPIPLAAAFCGNKKVIVAGSTWEEDEEELDHYANTHPEYRFIIAPHEIEEDRLRDAEKLFKHSIRYSQLARLSEAAIETLSSNVLIIDNIGMLSRLYYYAHIAYVGGGFGESGIHNILEAAVFGKPVLFGPVFDWYNEAVDLIEAGAAFSIDNAIELEQYLDQLMDDPASYQLASKAAAAYVQSKKGATDTIMRYIQENRLLTRR